MNLISEGGIEVEKQDWLFMGFQAFSDLFQTVAFVSDLTL